MKDLRDLRTGAAPSSVFQRWCVGSLLFAVAISSSATAQTNLLPNGDFDSNVATWSHIGDPEIELTWDSAVGSPSAGSLRLARSSSTSAEGSGSALSPCFETIPSMLYELRRRTRAGGNDPAVRCRVYLSFYEGAGCTGERLTYGFSDTVLPDPHDVWQSRASVDTPLAFPSFRVASLGSFSTTGGPASCNFDSVILSEPSPENVPALSETGVIALASLIGVVGLILLHIRATKQLLR